MRRLLAGFLLTLACAKPGPTATPAPASTATAAPVPAAGWVAFEADGKYGFKDAGGAVVVPARYQIAMDADGALACAVDDRGWVCLDGRGQEVLRPHVLDNGPDPFVDDRARFVGASGHGFYDRRGVVVIPARFDYAGPFSEGRAVFCTGCQRSCDPGGETCEMRGGAWGLIDRDGREVVPATYDSIDAFADGQARAVKGGVEVALDRDGEVVPAAK